jgi:hypothetical protein
MMSKLSAFLKNVFIIFGFLVFGVLLGTTVVFLEINKILGTIVSYLKKIFKRSE